MLSRLQIQNYAIIESINIDFSPNGLHVITGETGAGKSILMGALSLILGSRADSSALLHRDKKCVVEGVFMAGGKQQIGKFLVDNELDEEAELVIRREIGTNGKSRAFVNDTPVNLEQLRALSSMLVDLHQQFDTLELGDSGFQREVIDALAGNAIAIRQYQNIFVDLNEVRKKLETLQTEKQQFTASFDYKKFLFDELDALGLHQNELEDLENELQLLSNAEAIKQTLTGISFILNESDQPVVAQLKSSWQQLQQYISFQPALSAVAERLHSVNIELQDIAGELEQIGDHIEYDQKRIEQINDKLSSGYSLFKKHNVRTTNELLAIKEELGQQLEMVLNIDDVIASTQQQLNSLTDRASEVAKAISVKRLAQIKPFEQQVNALLARVGMPNARVRVQIQQTELNQFGIDSVEILFDGNKSNRFEPLRKVASGGELSRLMLCIKSLVAQSIDLPTLIFDEIDTGISGEAARQVGIILQELGSARQVICITHQPQIAGRAAVHYFVYKETRNQSIKTNLRKLENEERIETIARMLGGEKPTAAALQNAREMVMQ